jgi:hypothetical protein
MSRALCFFACVGLLVVPACDGGGGDPIDGGPPDAPLPDVPEVPADAPFVVDPGSCDTWGIGPLGAPITGLVPGTWTWVDFPEAHCANGSSTGIGINLSPSGVNRIAIFLEGGGACFDPISCVAVANPDGFDGTDFRASVSQIGGYDLFSRTNASNPVREWTHVYVPYCTGDVHSGTNPMGYRGREQVGYRNVTEYLRRLAPTFDGAEMVLLTGSSAGGLGALANYDQVQQAFGCTPVHMVDDSGPILGDETLRPCLQTLARQLWHFEVPADCPQCTNEDGAGLVWLWAYLATKYPDRRFALLSNTGDQTMRQFYGYGLSASCSFSTIMPAEMYEAGLVDLRDRVLAPYPNTATFYVTSMRHTFLTTDYARAGADGTTVQQWISMIIDGDAAWGNVGP